MRKTRFLQLFIILIGLFLVACSCGLLNRGKGEATEEQKSPKATVTTGIAAAVEPAPGTQPPLPEPTREEAPQQINGNLVSVPINGRQIQDITDLWTAPDGRLWAASTDGIHIQSGAGWEHILAGVSVWKIAGAGKDGTVWVLPEGAASIFACSAGKCTEYGSKQGWEPFPESQYLSPSIMDGIVQSPDGQLWLVTGLDDLRRFNPSSGRWEKFAAARIGFPAYDNPDYQGYYLTDAILSGSGKIWVGSCIGEGETLEGRGVVRFSDGSWNRIDAVKNACVMDMEVDPDGNAYVGDFDQLHRYSPVSGNWKSEALPSYDRRQLVERIDMDASGRLWVEVRRMGGASSFGGTALYLFQESSGWDPVYDPGETVSFDFAAAPGGEVYFSSNGQVIRWRDHRLEEMGNLEGTGVLLAVDGYGVAWAAVTGGTDSGLWKINR